MRAFIFFSIIFALLQLNFLLAGKTSPSTGKWTKLEDGVLVPVPPTEHPRLYLRAGDLEDLRERIKHPVLKPTWDNLQRLGEMNAHYSMAVNALRYLLDGEK